MIERDRSSSQLGLLSSLLRDPRGVSALEYGLYASLIALAAIQAISGLGFEVSNSIDDSATRLGEQNARLAGGNGPNDPNAPDEPAAIGEAPPLDSTTPLEPAPAGDQMTSTGADTTTPDEPPVAAAMAPSS